MGCYRIHNATGIDNLKVDKESDYNKPASDPEIG
jgi:5,10-methenyltetrahydromethanopterin hydrogenase